MRVGRLIVFLGVAAAVAFMAATAGARTSSARTTTVTFWDAYSAGGGEVKTLENVVIPGFERRIRESSSRTSPFRTTTYIRSL